MSTATSSDAAPQRKLTLLDSTCIIVGIIVGSAIYERTPGIAGDVPDTLSLAGVWILGGLFMLAGALCYAELATTYPEDGGEYVYLTRAFGRRLGFIYVWAQYWIINPGAIGAVAFVFARYLQQLCPLPSNLPGPLIYASGAIALLTIVNILGVQGGKWTQNILTLAKTAGLVLLIGLALASGGPSLGAIAREAALGAVRGPGRPPDFRLAMIMIMFAYGGWNQIAFVVAEVRNPSRNILRALLLGAGAVTAIYVLLNLGFAHALGLSGFRHSEAVAVDIVQPLLPHGGAAAISVLICLSTLGSVNGQILTSARVFYAFGKQHRLYHALGRWNGRLGTPVWSLVLQGLITLVLVIGFGLYANDSGQQSGFDRLVQFTTPAFWFFFLLVGLSLLVLRRRDPQRERPYRVLAYPVTPLLFCASSLFMLYSSFTYALDNRSYEGLWAIGLLAIGCVLSCFDPPVEGVTDVEQRSSR